MKKSFESGVEDLNKKEAEEKRLAEIRESKALEGKLDREMLLEAEKDIEDSFTSKFYIFERSIDRLKNLEGEQYTGSKMYLMVEKLQEMANNEYRDLFQKLSGTTQNEIYTKLRKLKKSFEDVVVEKALPEDDKAVVDTRDAFNAVEAWMMKGSNK